MNKTEIEIWNNRLGFRILSAENDIATGNLVDLALKAYEGRNITIEKLEYLLGLANHKLEDMGIEYIDFFYSLSIQINSLIS